MLVSSYVRKGGGQIRAREIVSIYTKVETKTSEQCKDGIKMHKTLKKKKRERFFVCTNIENGHFLRTSTDVLIIVQDTCLCPNFFLHHKYSV